MKTMTVDAAFRRHRRRWQITLGGQTREVRLRIRSGQALVYVDEALASSSRLPTLEQRWLLLTIPGALPSVAVAVVRFPNTSYGAAAFVDSVNVDDGSNVADWGPGAFPPMDRFEDGTIDSGVLKPPAALLFALVFGGAYLSGRPVTVGALITAAVIAVSAAAWVLFCGRALIPYMASQHQVPVTVRYLTLAAVFSGGMFGIILALIALLG
jgi:hypothetical protein